MRASRAILSLGVVLVPLAAGLALAQDTSPQATGGKRAFKTADWYRLTWLSAAQLSPDGSKIAFQVTTVHEAANKRHNEIWVVPTTGGDPVRFTSPTTEAETPRWSDDGKLLMFQSDRAGRMQQWALHMDQPGEAFQTNDRAAPAPVERVATNMPLDKSFTVTTDDGAAGLANGGAGRGGRGGGGGGGGRGGRGGAADDSSAMVATSNPLNDFYTKYPMAKPPSNAITKPEDPMRFNGMEITDARFKNNDIGFVPSTGAGGRGGAGGGGGGRGGGRGAGGAGGAAPVAAPVQIYLTRGTSPKVTLTATAYSHRNVEVSPDGKWISFTADPALRADSIAARDSGAAAGRGGRGGRAGGGGGGRGGAAARGAETQGAQPPVLPDRNTADLFVLPVAACEAKTSACKPVKIDYFGEPSAIEWSPDSKYIAFIGHPGPRKDAHLMFATPAGGKAQEAIVAWPFEPGATEWLKDGTLAVTAITGGSNGLYRFDPATRKATPIVGGRRTVTSLQWDKSHSHVVYIATDVSHPTELFIANGDGTGEKKLTSFNDKVNSEIAWSDAERFTYKSVGNLEIEGWLMKPYGYQPGKKYPLVLYIHGGPHSAYDEGWFDEFQNLAGGGFMVLYTNPRGSSNYGTEFSGSTLGRWGAEDYQDLMKAVDIASVRPDVDSTKMGVTGGSYGGFMTAWIETKTTRFKAAETDRMISEWTYWWGASDAQTLTNGEFFGTPWENQAMYDSLSPIRHVANVKTPTLLVQSEEDFRAPIGDAELWYEALKTLNVPAEFVRYPRSNHDLSRTGEPWLLVDRLSRIRQWFTHWLM